MTDGALLSWSSLSELVVEEVLRIDEVLSETEAEDLEELFDVVVFSMYFLPLCGLICVSSVFSFLLTS